MRTLLCLAVLATMGAETLNAQCWGPICWDDDRRHRDRGRDRAGPVAFGVRGGYDFGDDTGMAGAQLRIPIIPQLALVPSGDVFFDDSPTEWQLNADVAARPRALGGVYGGGGAAFVNRDFAATGDNETEVGYNLFIGMDGGPALDARLRPFVEARWTAVDDYDPFRLVAGFNVPL
jgi:hypothetical protein